MKFLRRIVVADKFDDGGKDGEHSKRLGLVHGDLTGKEVSSQKLGLAPPSIAASASRLSRSRDR